MMNVLFDIIHPAHVHLFKNFIKYLKENDHSVFVTSRGKDITVELLDHYKIEHVKISDTLSSPAGMIKEQLARDWKIFKLHRKHKFDISFGTSISIAHLSALTKVKSFVFNEDDDNSQPTFCMASYPFASGVCIPECIQYYKFLGKRMFHNSYHELAYLHPNNFVPDENVLKKYNLEKHNYIIARFSALKAHHDIGKKGISEELWKKITDLTKDIPLIRSVENMKTHQIEPWDMHHVLALSKILISDSQSMTMEAANLGVPSIRYSSFVGKLSVVEELEHKYGLTFGFRPGADKELLIKLEELLATSNLRASFKVKRESMLKEKIDLSQWIINLFEKETRKN
jgi:predicted glycosyltransferase